MRRSRGSVTSRCPTNCTRSPPATCRVVARADRCSGCSPVRYVTVYNRLVVLKNTERQGRYRERRKAGESRYRQPADWEKRERSRRNGGTTSAESPCRSCGHVFSGRASPPGGSLGAEGSALVWVWGEQHGRPPPVVGRHRLPEVLALATPCAPRGANTSLRTRRRCRCRSPATETGGRREADPPRRPPHLLHAPAAVRIPSSHWRYRSAPASRRSCRPSTIHSARPGRPRRSPEPGPANRRTCAPEPCPARGRLRNDGADRPSQPSPTPGGYRGPRFARNAFTTHGRSRPSTRFARPPLRCGPSDDCRDRPCGKPLQASRKAGPQSTGNATPASRSGVAEHRRRLSDGTRAPSWLRAVTMRRSGTGSCEPRTLAHVAEMPTRCGSKRVPLRSIAQATLSRRSATERRARACP